MQVHRPKDFLTGILFILFGGSAMYFSTAHAIGSAEEMGPGYFPLVLGGCLACLGVVILSKSLLRGGAFQGWPAFHFKPPALVLSSVVLFGLLLKPLGLPGATFVLVLVCSLASHEFSWREALLNSAVLIVIVLTVFVYLLEFQAPVWPSFVTGLIR
ncbi:MAG: tripartite tricarboxylate transporter TctB family protein [Syntrophobacteraceae bacterium]